MASFSTCDALLKNKLLCPWMLDRSEERTNSYPRLCMTSNTRKTKRLATFPASALELSSMQIGSEGKLNFEVFWISSFTLLISLKMYKIWKKTSTEHITDLDRLNLAKFPSISLFLGLGQLLLLPQLSQKIMQASKKFQKGSGKIITIY